MSTNDILIMKKRINAKVKDRTIVHFRIEPDLETQMRYVCNKTGIAIANLCNRAIRKYLIDVYKIHEDFDL